MEIKLDLSINLHPLGVPNEIETGLINAIGSIATYPDPYCRELIQAISQKEGIGTEKIICGNGAADVIYRLVQCLSPKKALLTAPTFSAYETALQSSSCEIIYHALLPEENFQLTRAILDKITPDLDMVFLCTPNNPTAQTIPPALMEEIAAVCDKNSCYLLIDECFLELSHHPHSFDYLLENPYVFLLRAFTKSYALAGLRLGYGLCSHAPLLEKMHRVAQPWSVSVLAQKSGVIACSIPEWTATGREIIRKVQPKLVVGLCLLQCNVWEGEGNFILFQKPGCIDLQEKLKEYGIFIRHCANYRGLGEDFYRIAITTEDKTAFFLEKLNEVFRTNGYL